MPRMSFLLVFCIVVFVMETNRGDGNEFEQVLTLAEFSGAETTWLFLPLSKN